MLTIPARNNANTDDLRNTRKENESRRRISVISATEYFGTFLQVKFLAEGRTHQFVEHFYLGGRKVGNVDTPEFTEALTSDPDVELANP